MATGKTGALQRLLAAMAAPTPADWSAAELERMHRSILPAARYLAPTDGDRPTTVPDIKAYGKEKVVVALKGFMGHLVTALDEEDIRARGLAQQACDMLCALSDVLHEALAPGARSSGRPKLKDAAVFQFMQMPAAEDVVHILARTARQLNKWIFRTAASMPPDLLGAACMCCQRISIMMDGWYNELDHLEETLRLPGALNLPHAQRCRLTGWYLESDLLSLLAEGVLLVLGQEPGYAQEQSGVLGAVLFAHMVNIAVLSFSTATRMQSSMIHISSGLDRKEGPLQKLGQQEQSAGTTTTTPFLRLALVVLAAGQYWRRAAALPPGSVKNQPNCSRVEAATLRRAMKQQLTPSCCSQLLQRAVPWYWQASTRYALEKQYQELLACDNDDACSEQIVDSLLLIGRMCQTYAPPAEAVGLPELQLLVECAEVHAATAERNTDLGWYALSAVLRACPYSILVEFNSHYGRTLLTLAEGSLEAGLAAEAAAGRTAGGASSSRDPPAGAGGGVLHLEVAAELANSLRICLRSEVQARQHAQGDASSFEAQGYPADATWALLDPSTAPRLMRLMEARLRTPGCGDHTDRVLQMLPCALPELELFYSDPSTARAVLSAVTSVTKWLQGKVLALEMLLQHPTDKSAAAAAVRAAAPGAAGGMAAKAVATPVHACRDMCEVMLYLSSVVVCSLVRAAALVDDVLLDSIAAAPAAAPAGAPVEPVAAEAAAAASRCSRAWLVEKALLAVQQRTGPPVPPLPAAYIQKVASTPQLVAPVQEQLQQGFRAQLAAAAGRQAAKLVKQKGVDVSALTQQLQSIQLGGGSSSSSGDSSAGPSSSTVSSLAADMPPVTAGDITVAVNALLVACKAAGALLGVPQLLEQVHRGLTTHDWITLCCHLHSGTVSEQVSQVRSAMQNMCEWAVLLHPLLAQLLPAEQGQVLASLQGRLVGGSNSSSGAGGAEKLQQEGAGTSSRRLSDEEVDAVLGALRSVVVPEQPGCNNPRCCCLEGPTEAEMKFQACAACRGARYCSAACQRAHWSAGHKEVCKAVQAAVKAAAADDAGAT